MKTNSVIELKFDKTISNLTGNTFGRITFNNQVSEQIGKSYNVQIVFPASIENIGTSFIQGFFSTLVEEIGFEGIENNIDIKADGVDNAKAYVMEKLKF